MAGRLSAMTWLTIYISFIKFCLLHVIPHCEKNWILLTHFTSLWPIRMWTPFISQIDLLSHIWVTRTRVFHVSADPVIKWLKLHKCESIWLLKVHSFSIKPTQLFLFVYASRQSSLRQSPLSGERGSRHLRFLLDAPSPEPSALLLLHFICRTLCNR